MKLTKTHIDRVAVFCATYLIFLIAILTVPFIFLKSNGSVFILAAGLSVPIAWFVAFLLQIIIKRPRPFQNGEQPLIDMLFKTPSFPSAHSTIAFAIAGSWIWVDYLNDFFPVTGLVFLILAILMAWSRVRVRVHYVSDTIAGAVLGIGMSGAVLYLAILAFAD